MRTLKFFLAMSLKARLKTNKWSTISPSTIKKKREPIQVNIRYQTWEATWQRGKIMKCTHEITPHFVNSSLVRSLFRRRRHTNIWMFEGELALQIWFQRGFWNYIKGQSREQKTIGHFDRKVAWIDPPNEFVVQTRCRKNTNQHIV